MKLTKKIILFILAICFFFLLLFFVLYRLLLTEPIEIQKHQKAKTIIAGAQMVLDNEKDRITTITEDWAVWDTMYQFTSRPNEEVLKDLAPPFTLRDAELSLIYLMDRNRKVVINAAYENEKAKYINFPSLEEKKGPLWDFIQQSFAQESTVSGLVPTHYGTLLIVSAKVLRSDGSGPMNGRLLMAHLIDPSFEEKISRAIRESTRLLKPNPQEPLPHPFTLLEKKDHMLIYYPLKDYRGQPVLVIQVKAQKQVFKLLDDAARLFFLLLMLGFLLFGVLSYYVIHRLVVRRVMEVSSKTDKIVTFDDLSLRISEHYRDEITQLCKNINMMLQRLQTENQHRMEIEKTLILNEKLIFLGNVTARIAHEINNPLFAIDNAFKHLKEFLPAKDEDMATIFQMLEKEIKRVRVITRDMHRVTIRQMDSFAPADLSEIIEAAINVATWSKQIKDTVIDYKKQGCRFSLNCNPDTLQQVFMNVINNSIEAMDGKGRLEIDVTSENSLYRIDIYDNGPGIDKDILPVLFSPFHTTKSGKGSGLGLYISHNIIVNHGGTIEVDGDYSNGTHFIIHIPEQGDNP